MIMLKPHVEIRRFNGFKNMSKSHDSRDILLLILFRKPRRGGWEV